MTEEEKKERDRKRSREFYYNHKQEASARMKRWRENNPERVKEYNKKQVAKRIANRIAEGTYKPRPKRPPLPTEEILAFFKKPEDREEALWIIEHKKKTDESHPLP